MLLEKLLLETLVKKVPRKSVAKNNCMEMLPKSLPLETFVKKKRSKMLPEKY